MWFLAFKILKWITIAAAVQTYIVMGPGGESVQALLMAIAEQLAQIDWKGLLSTALEHGKTLLTSLIDWLQSNPEIQQQLTDTKELAETVEQGGQ